MSTVLGIWHLVLTGGEAKKFITPAAVQITNVSLGEEIADSNGRSVVKLSFESLSASDDEDDEEDGPDLSTVTTVLCSLTPGKIEQVALNVTLGSEEGYTLQVTGKNTIYFTGHYLDQRSPEDQFIDSELDSDEDAYDLREVSSDVEMHRDELESLESDGGRLEEVNEEVEKPTKRPRDSEDSPSKPGKKKLKAEGGNAVPADIPAQDKASKKEKKKQKHSGDKVEQQQKDSSKSESKTDNVSKKTITGGIIVQDHKTGTGPLAKKGDTVKMRYIGKLTNGKEFDKNISGKPFVFHLGKGEVIKGWDEGIVGMQVGGERVLTIPPNMAYGNRTQEGIPANSTLVFEVKLLHIK